MKKDCQTCWHRHKMYFREGRSGEVKLTIWKCHLTKTTVYFRRKVRTKVTDEYQSTTPCSTYTPYPWLNSPIHKKWQEQNVQFRRPYRLKSW